MKKRTNYLILFVLVVLLAMTGCGNGERPAEKPSHGGGTPQVTKAPEPTESEAFEAYTEELFFNDIAANTINLHYTLAYPENFGITEYPISLGSASYEGMVESFSFLRQLQRELEGFDYELLSEEQQFTYDILMDFIETELSVEEMVLYTEFLGPVTGYQAQLPVLLAEYTFRREQDIEDYLALLCVIDDTYQQMVEFETEKSEAGLFMSDATLEQILEQCRQFIENPEENYMIEIFDAKVAEAEWLTDAQREEYSKRNKELITTEVVGAYQLLIDGLTELKGSGTNDMGMCYFEKGKEYYEYLAYTATGSGKSVAEMAVVIPQTIQNAIMEMQTVMQADPGVLDRFENPLFDITDPAEILEDLKEKIAGVFPELPEVTYQIKYVHPSMQEHLSPAFYLTPPIDDYTGNVIYINEPYVDGDLYVTMAHEGFPGHLYQTVYTSSKDLPLVRNLFGYSGYTEGWAQYVELMAYEIGGNDANLAKLKKANAIATLGIYAILDIGVNYYGWSVDAVEEYLYSYGLGSREAAEWIFDYVVAEPSNYLSYFVGYLEFVELQKTAEETWGENYSDMKFYDAVLSLGPAPFPLLEKQIISME